MKATAKIFLDIFKTNSEGLHPVSIRITFNRTRRYFPLGLHFDQANFENPKTRRNKDDIRFAESMLAKAITIIDALAEGFSFELFERSYLKNRALKDTLRGAFEDYIENLSPERTGTKSAYTDAMKSFFEFKPKASFAEVTVKWLHDYESWMDERERSKTTIGMYTRALRAIFNERIEAGNISKERYPFGEKKYDPPTGKNTKKALGISGIAKIFSAKLDPGSTGERMVDYWKFLYLCNGINVADFCHLKQKDFDGETISFIRQKTKRTKRVAEEIRISVQQPAIEIINKYRVRSINKNEYLFPHLTRNMDYDEQRKTIKNLTRLINSYTKDLSNTLKIKMPIKTMEARHSFATIVQYSGAPVAMISQMLGHTSIATTQNYLDSFEKKTVQKATAALLDFKQEDDKEDDAAS